jgi:hypothetical protein
MESHMPLLRFTADKILDPRLVMGIVILGYLDLPCFLDSNQFPPQKSIGTPRAFGFQKSPDWVGSWIRGLSLH